MSQKIPLYRWWYGGFNVTLGDDCTWTLTADTYITSLKGDTSRIKSNGYRLFVGGKELKMP